MYFKIYKSRFTDIAETHRVVAVRKSNFNMGIHFYTWLKGRFQTSEMVQMKNRMPPRRDMPRRG